MRNKIDITNVKFRVAGVGPRQVSRNDKTQKRTPPSDGNRLIWSVRLNAIEETATGKTTEQIFVEVAGEMPQLVIDELAAVHNLTYQPWAAAEQVNGQWKGKVMRAYRADSIVMADASARRVA